MTLSFDNAVEDVKKVMDKNPARLISQAVENMLKTGRLATQTGLDLQQVLVYWQHFCLSFANCASFFFIFK